MKPEFLTSKVRNAVLQALKELPTQESGVIKTKEDLENFILPFYKPVKEILENNLQNFCELMMLEKKYGFISGYLGGGNLNSDKDTTIKIE